MTQAQIFIVSGSTFVSRGLAARSRVSLPTIQRIEATIGMPISQERTILDLAKTIEAAGVEFIGTPENGPGVRLKSLRDS